MHWPSAIRSLSLSGLHPHAFFREVNGAAQDAAFFSTNLLHQPWPAPLLLSRSVVSSSLRPHELQHARLPCPSVSLGVCSNSCLLSQVMLSNHFIFCCPLLLLPSIFPSIRACSLVDSLHQVVKVLELQLQHQSFQ